MFFSMIASAVTSILSIFVNFFPAVDPEVVDLITLRLTDFRETLASANWIFPVGEFFTILSAVFVIEALYWVFKFIRYLLSNISLGFLK